jgi:oligopeptide transport system permease protein
MNPSHPSITPLARFAQRRSATIAAAAIILALVLATIALPITSNWYDVQDIQSAIRHPPTAQPPTPWLQYQSAADLTDASATKRTLATALFKISGWFGYDDLGRSVLIRTMFGWLVSLGIGLGAAAIAVGVGVLYGATSALLGGRIDRLMMRTVDTLYGLPYVLFVMLLKVTLDPWLTDCVPDHPRLTNTTIVFLAIGALSWLTMARVIRGQVLTLKNQTYVHAARANGATTWRILTHHILPNLVGTIIVYASLVIPQAILQESFLSFLGIGVAPPTPSLGRLAADGVHAVNSFVGFWWLIAFPCGILVATMLALNAIGDGLRAALDPKSQQTSAI